MECTYVKPKEKFATRKDIEPARRIYQCRKCDFQTILNYNLQKHMKVKHKDEIFKLQLEGIIPIMAHPERYRGVQQDVNIAKRWIDRGFIIQIDCASILGKFGEDAEKCAKSLLENQLCHLVGSDAHNDKNRNFLLKQTHQKLIEIIGENATDIIKNNSERVLEGQDCLNYKSTKKSKSFLGSFFNFKKR